MSIINTYSKLAEAADWKIGYTLKEGNNYWEILEFNNELDKYGNLQVLVKDFEESRILKYRIGKKQNRECITTSSGYELIYIPIPYSNILKDANDMMNGTFDMEPYIQDKKQSTELMSFNKDTYIAYKNSLELKRSRLISIEETCKQLLRNRMTQMKSIMREFEAKITKLKRIIFTIELYLGIEEHIHQIKQGKSSDDTIYLMQQRLYMDEELGDPTDNGLEIKDIEMFDEWLLKKNEYYQMFNYELFVPFQKSVRIMRVRRYEKDRGIENPFLREIMSRGDFETYILIRNGENIYRICSKLNFGEKLFPEPDELIKIYEKEREHLLNVNRRNGEMLDDNRKEQLAQQRMKDEMEIYQRNIILMQGLVDRTEVFGKVFGKINFMDGSSAENGDVEFFYEDESKRIDSGIESPLAWLEKAKQYDEGDQVLLLKNPDRSRRFWSDHFDEASSHYMFKLSWNRKNFPNWPKVNKIYQVFKESEKEREKRSPSAYDGLKYIKYIPHKDYWEKKTNRRVAFRLDDSFVVNLNVISHRDMHRMWELMHDRRDRKHYLSTMSAILTIRRFKLEQLEEEKPFAKLIMSQCNVDLDIAQDYIHWWKTKNKWKRNLSVDDKKALRMIKKYHKTL